METPRPIDYRVDKLCAEASGLPEEEIALLASRYPGNPLCRDPFGRLRYSDAFLSYMISICTPLDQLEARDEEIRDLYETLLMEDWIKAEKRLT